MFKRSLTLALSIVASAFVASFAVQLWQTHDLPSSQDPGLSIGQAFQTSKTPLLVEFYSDDCGTCRRVSPWIHALHEKNYKNRLTLVMLDVTDSENQNIARLFKVESLPGVYIFDHRHMKKHAIPPEALVSEGTLRAAIDDVLKRLPAQNQAQDQTQTQAQPQTQARS